MRIFICLLIFIFSLFIYGLHGQSVGINQTGADPDSSSILDVQSTTQGILIPRMDSSQRVAIANPATGLLVFDTQSHSFWFYEGSGWTELVADAPARLADADGNTQIQVEESTNDNTIRFDVDGSEAMVLDPSGNLMVRGADPDDPGFLSLYNGDSTHFMRFYGGRTGDPDPFINWRSGNDLRFTSSDEDYAGFAEYMRLTQNGQLGLGTNSPQSQFHVENGQILMRGDFVSNYNGAIPDSGAGTRLMWIPEKSAFRVGRISGTLWDLDSIGDYSTVAGGFDNTASGERSFVGGGSNNTASGESSFVGGGFSNTVSASGIYSFVGGGFSNTASGSSSFVGGGFNNSASDFYSFVGGGFNNSALGENSFVGGGFNNTASGSRSFVGGGEGNTAYSYGEAVFGLFEEPYTPQSTISINSNDRLFVVGNGTGTIARSNALTILKNGNLGLGTSSPQAQLHVENGQMLMRGTFISNYNGTIPESGAGTRLMWIPEKSAFRVGTVSGTQWDLDSIGDYSTVAGGINNTASGNASFIGGGKQNNVSADFSMAVGENSTAYGHTSSVVGGYNNTASGDYSLAGGYHNEAISYAEVVLGYYAVNATPTGSSPSVATSRDRLFSVGNGTPSARSNALTILKDGLVGIGTSNPTQALLEVDGGITNTSLTSYWYSSFGGQFNTTYTGITLSARFSNDVAANGFFAFSDARIKRIEGISDAEQDLQTLMQIEVTDYRMKDSIAEGNRPYKKVIAQQVAEVYPQAVTANLTDVVPDIYQRAELQDGWIMLSTDLQAGERVKLITEQSSEVYEVLTVEHDRFQVSGLETVSPLASQIFVYGREVDDFHTVDYEAISMLNVSATQAQQQLIEAQQAEIEALKSEVEQLRSLQERILRLEASLNQ